MNAPAESGHKPGISKNKTRFLIAQRVCPRVSSVVKFREVTLSELLPDRVNRTGKAVRSLLDRYRFGSVRTAAQRINPVVLRA